MTDNVTTPLPGSTKFKTKDTGANGHLTGHTLYDEAEAEVLGKVTASPTANTVLARLMDILSLVVLAAGSNIIGKVGIDQTTPGTTNGVQVNAALPAGTNNIGDVDVLSLPATPAGTNLIGKVSASHETSTIYNGTTALTPKFKVISCSSSGNNEIVAAVTGKKIRVLAWDVSPSDIVNFKWRTASTDITGLYYAANAGNGVSKPFSPVGYFETASDEALNLNLSAAEAVGGSLVYVEV
jgi:hypothetical protein